MEEEFYLTNENNETDINNDAQSINDLSALQNILNILKPYDKKSVRKILRTVLTFYDFENIASTSRSLKSEELNNTTTKFSENRDITPKDFMMEKNPQTDIERVACLAYYLTHYRNQEEFKTIDLSKLNTEAAQLKLSNPAVAVDHATRSAGYFVPTEKGFKKLSAIGELYVQALPNRDEAKEVIEKNRPRKRQKRNNKKI